MNGMTSPRWWLALLGLIAFASIGESQTPGRPNVKVDTVFKFQVNVKVGPEIQRPTAPWYAYFPADPRMMAGAQASPYPTWPQQFPPAMPPADAQKDPLKKLSYDPGSMPVAYWPTYLTSGYAQPVGHVPMQAPSYWYQGR